MPRLSIYKPEKGNDYKFFDRNIKEMFQVGGTDLNFHKYLGPYDQGALQKDGNASPSSPDYSGQENVNELTIQDLLFLENIDRRRRADIDFNLSQFGMFLQNDTIFLTVHLNDAVERVGRKPMSGDVIEFPHMKEDYSLDQTIPIALKRFYVIEDVNRAAEGFSQTWWPHLLRLKMKSLVDSQEFRDILGDATTSGSLASYMSTFNREKQINEAVVNQAEVDAPKSGFNYKQYYVTPIDEKGNIRTDNINNTTDRVSIDKPINAVIDTPASSTYGFYYDGDGVAPNGYPSGFGTSFPTTNRNKGDYFLRTDFLPNRLFRFDGIRWVKVEDSIRLTTTNDDTRGTWKTKFVNTSGSTTINGLTVEQRQSLSDALKPKADN
jgi:hypothetical protein